MSGTKTEMVLAAGGVVLDRSNGDMRVAVVHRPRYDDWSLPKGKLEPGEGAEEAALREVQEETGFRCALGEPVGQTAYRDRRGRRKVVRFWRMTPLEGEFTPSREVDEVRWLPLPEAIGMLSHEHERQILRALDAG
jgi:8-oxo-dGTP pyrophosphatase MutT (NUDIX family)